MRNVISTIVPAVVSAMALAAAGAYYLAATDTWLKDDKLVSAVEKQVHFIQPSRAERRFDEIGWAPSILAAEALARKNDRPVFLFTYDGNIDTGRC
jgi:hypothetical protein